MDDNIKNQILSFLSSIKGSIMSTSVDTLKNEQIEEVYSTLGMLLNAKDSGVVNDTPIYSS